MAASTSVWLELRHGGCLGARPPPRKAPAGSILGNKEGPVAGRGTGQLEVWTLASDKPGFLPAPSFPGCVISGEPLNLSESHFPNCLMESTLARCDTCEDSTAAPGSACVPFVIPLGKRVLWVAWPSQSRPGTCPFHGSEGQWPWPHWQVSLPGVQAGCASQSLSPHLCVPHPTAPGAAPRLSAFSVPPLRRAAEQKNKSNLLACLGAHDAPSK